MQYRRPSVPLRFRSLDRLRRAVWPACAVRIAPSAELLEPRLFLSSTPNSFVVTDTSDSGTDTGSLRFAINEADAASGASTITFDSGAFPAGQTTTIDLASALAITNPAEIFISANNNVALSGQGQTAVLSISTSASAELDDLTITDGTATIGAGITNSGTLTLSNCTITNNAGGGVYNQATGNLSVTGSTFSGNSVSVMMVNNIPVGGVGAGLQNSGAASVSNSTFNSNNAYPGDGGAIENSGTLGVTAAAFNQNTALMGGAIANAAGDMLTVTGSTFLGNQSAEGGALDNLGTANVSSSTLNNNSAIQGPGGAIENDSTLTLTQCGFTSNAANASGTLTGASVQTGLNIQAAGSVSGGSAPQDVGGAVNNLGALTVGDSSFTNNTAQAGGAISNGANVSVATIAGSTFTGNTSTDFGGAINNSNTLTLAQSTLTSNSSPTGGAIYSTLSLSVSGSTLSGNTSSGNGGAVYTVGYSTLTAVKLNTNTASGNGGAIYADGSTSSSNVTLASCTLTGNSAVLGGAIFNAGSVSAPDAYLTVEESTLNSNAASTNGGAIYNNGGANGSLVNVLNCTFANNTTPGDGGAIYAEGNTFVLTDSTVANNSAASGGGVFGEGSDFTLNGSLLADDPGGDLIAAPLTFTGSYNLIGDGSGGLAITSNNILNVNPLLGTLGNYGGPTQTIPLLPGSPALGASSIFTDPSGAVISDDQRGNGRSRSTPDIGAFESSGFVLTAILGSAQSTTIGTPFANTLLVGVAAKNPTEPVVGGTITFTGPSSASTAGVTPFFATETISSRAQAFLQVTANSVAGSYAVIASDSTPGTAGFVLTNSRATPTVKVTAPNEPSTGNPYALASAMVGGLGGAAVTDGSVTFAFYSTTDPADPLAAPPSTAGSYRVVANFSGDNNYIPASSAPVSFQILQGVPTFISSAGATFTVGTGGSFTITTSGSPTAALTESGALPAGVTFTDNGDGTATLFGTPAATTGGSYTLTITANNGASTNPQQSFALTVDEAPAITSLPNTVFATGAAGSFTITTTGYPAPLFDETGPLPPGVTFTDNGNGTATISGTPAIGSQATYGLSFTASNVVSGAGQSFTLFVVNPSSAQPSITFSNGEISAIGTPDADTASLSISGTTLVVTINSVTKNFALASVNTIDVSMEAGDDSVTIGAGVPAVFVNGGGGNDTITAANSAGDTLQGGVGRDSISAASGNNLLDGGTGGDTLKAGSGDDTLTGDGANDKLHGGSGSALLEGGDGNDTITAGSGNSTLEGGVGNDSLVGGSGLDLLKGNSGDDTLVAGAGDNTLRGNGGEDDLTGNDGGDNLLSGGPGDDTLTGAISSGGTDTLLGGTGTNSILPGPRDIE